MTIEFEAFPKIPRFSGAGVVVTEKIDGTNACIIFSETAEIACQSRKRLITPDDDNYGFAAWAYANADGLFEALGPGRHFGEWWGAGILRGYGLRERRFSLFNVDRWQSVDLTSGRRVDFSTLDTDLGLGVVPVLYRGVLDPSIIEDCVQALRVHGSFAEPGFMDPEGVVIYLKPSGALFKKFVKNDTIPKGAQEVAA